MPLLQTALTNSVGTMYDSCSRSGPRQDTVLTTETAAGRYYMTIAFEPQALKLASEQFATQRADAKRHFAEEVSRQEREDAAWAFADAVLQMDHAAHEIQFGAVLLSAVHAKRVLPAFWVVCEALREAGLRDRLELLDAQKMIEVHGTDRDPELARVGFQQALALLSICTSPQFKKTMALQRQLRNTFDHPAGRHLWYMICAVVKGLLTNQGQLFIKAGIVPPRFAHISQFNSRNAARNWQWWEWRQQGMKPAQIRDRWNNERPDQKIAEKSRGRDVVRKTLQAIDSQVSADL